MKTLKTISFWIALPIAGVLGPILSIAGWNYAICPIYTFEEPKPFSGGHFYNPYQDIDAEGWRKCAFHLRANGWGYVTNENEPPERILSVYKELRYDVIVFSNHMNIDRAFSGSPFHIPTYVHGYGFKQARWLALGAREVVWRDYIFGQNLNKKQHIIDLLKTHSDYIALNHPAKHQSYSPNDYKYLSGYDFFEILKSERTTESEWDIALSNGHLVWLIANDGAPNVNEPSTLQMNATFVNISSPTSDEVLGRLAQGAAFGARFPQNRTATLEEKALESRMVSFPVSVQVREDSVQVVWQQAMRQIEFIGGNSAVLKTVLDTNEASYLIRPEDAFVRVKLTSKEGFVYFLNPIVRCAGGQPAKQLLGDIDAPRTFTKRLTIVGLLITAVAGYRKIYPLKKRRGYGLL